MPKRTLVVGTGSIGLRHLRLLRERAGLSVEVCDARPEGLAEAAEIASEVRSWSNFQEAVATSPQIVVIATPPTSHAALTCAALEGGAHVFCEKPISDSGEGARSMVAAQRQSGLRLNVGFVQRFMPELLYAKKLIDDGVIGRVCYARFEVGSHETLSLSRSRHQKALFGSAALDYVYGFDTFFWILGERPESVYAHGVLVPGLPLESNPNLLSAVIQYGSARLAELHIDYVAHPGRCSYTFQGELGYLQVDQVGHTVELGDREAGKRTEKTLVHDRIDVMRVQRDHFLEAVDGIHPVSTSGEEGLESILGVEALIRSLRSGKPEVVESP